MKKIKVVNLYGYPTLSPKIREYAKSIKALLVVDRMSLLRLTKEQASSTQPKILIDSLPIMMDFAIPILGYTDHNGIFFRGDLPHRDKLEPNIKVVKVPEKLDRPEPKLLLRALEAPNKSEFLKTFDEKSEEHRVLRGLINRWLPPTLVDPFEAPTKKKSQKKPRYGT